MFYELNVDTLPLYFVVADMNIEGFFSLSTNECLYKTFEFVQL